MIRVGECAVLLECASSRGVAQALAALTRDEALTPLDLVPGAETVLVVLPDPSRIDHPSLAEIERQACTSASGGAPQATGGGSDDIADASPTRCHEIPVRYDGPDLESVARRAGLAPSEVVERHSGSLYRVAFVGFQPGFGYLTGLEPQLHCPRLASPRAAVPAGSVAIGGEWTGVYPARSPGGWNLIGTAAIRLFDPAAEPPCLLLTGDGVRFVPL